MFALKCVPLKCLLFILASKIPPLNFILFSKCQFFDNSATIFYHPFSIHPLSILVDIYLFQRISYICSVFPIKFEKNDSFKRPRKSYRFRGLFWLIFGLLHDLFQVKCSKERIEIPPKYFQNYQFAVICTGCRRANFSKNDRGFHTLAIFVHEIAPMRAF